MNNDMQIISSKFLCELMPEAREVASFFVDPLNETFVSNHILTDLRIAAFLAQAGHESVRFSLLSETLNYSVRGLLRVYPQFFTIEQAQECAHNPMKIANRIYAGRNGNGDEHSGDGWLFRGRGLFPACMLGRSRYERLGIGLMADSGVFLSEPWQLARPEWACRSAGWIWTEIDGNRYADMNTDQAFKKLTHRINKGQSGMPDRLQLLKAGKTLLGPL
jgi:putative chitinase